MTTLRPVRMAGIGAVAGALAMGVASASAASHSPAPKKLANPVRTCEQLTARFQRYLSPGQNANLRRFVSPAFVIGRNDGTINSWPAYLENHPVFTGWNISVTLARFSTPVITCVAVTSTTQIVNGAPVVSVPTQNMSTYAWQRGAWRITSYARFNAVS